MGKKSNLKDWRKLALLDQLRNQFLFSPVTEQQLQEHSLSLVLFWKGSMNTKAELCQASIIALARCTTSDDQYSRAGGIKQRRNTPQGRLQLEFERPLVMRSDSPST